MRINPGQLRRLIALMSGVIENEDTPLKRKLLIEDAFIHNSALAKRIIDAVDLEEDTEQFTRQLIRAAVREDRTENSDEPLFLLMELIRDDLRGDDIRKLDNIKKEILAPESRSKIRMDVIIGVIGLAVAILTFIFGDGIIDNFNNLFSGDRAPTAEVIETEAVDDTPTATTPSSDTIDSGDLTLTAIYNTAQARQNNTQDTPATDIPPSATSVPSDTSVPPTRTSIPPSNTPRPTNTSVTIIPTATDAPVSTPMNAVREFDGVEMVLVPAGCFQMGSNAADAQPDEMPPHQVCVESFWIDRYEVTNAQYRQFESVAPNPPTRDEANYPRDNVSWFEANAHCAARDARLPTEAEWEYAASGQDNLIYPWGNQFMGANFVYSNNAGNTTAPVGSRGVTSWVGAYDMAGNAREWTATLYGIETAGTSDNNLNFSDTGETLYAYPYNPDDGRNAEPIVNNTQQPYVVIRGSTYSLGSDLARTASRDFVRPQLSVGGIRCVRDN